MTKDHIIKDKIIDKGNHIKVSDADDNTVLKALEMAKIKYGSTLNITGDDAFKTKVISLVQKHKLDIKFKDKNMNKTLTNLQQPFIIKILKSFGTWFLNKIISIGSFLFWVTASIVGAIVVFVIIVALFMFVAKLIHMYFGVGWMLTFIFSSFFFGFVAMISSGNTRRGVGGCPGSSGSGGYSDNGGNSDSGYAPYQGDRSMVGGVVGGSITTPVGGRAGQ